MAAQTIDLTAEQRASDARKLALAQLSIHRDLSIAVDAGLSPEGLGDRARDALKADADSIEKIEVGAQYSYYSLSMAARRRLGIASHQKNVLLNVVLRHPERALTSDEANELRDRIYAALHQGNAHQWTGRSMSL
jgi:phenylalanyl-tRNA synthetase alpha chain